MKPKYKTVGYLQVKELYKKGVRNFKNISCIGADFSKIDLREADFTDSDLSFTDFNDSDLRKTNFTDCKMMWSSFERTKMKDIIMKNADASWSDFQNIHFGKADLTNANLSCSLLQDVHFEKAEKHNLNTAWCVNSITQMTKEDIIETYEELKKWKGKIPDSLWRIVKTIIDRYEHEIKMLQEMSDISSRKTGENFRKDLNAGIKEYVESNTGPYKMGKKDYVSEKRGEYEK